MTSFLDAAQGLEFLPEGPNPGADLDIITIGVLVAIDRPTNRVMVSVHGSSGSWMPAVPGHYVPESTVYVVRNPWHGGRSELCVGPVLGSPGTVVGRLTAVSTSANRGTVTVNGTSYVLPYIPSAYTTPSDVWVLMNPTRGGIPELILGPCDVPPPPPEPDPEPEPGKPDKPVIPKPPPPPPEIVTRTVTINPTWSGTYRSAGGWDRWNTNRYGGRSTLYQGNGFGSGNVKGLATYGNQLVNLKALDITRVEVILRGAGLALPSYPSISLQGSPHGSKPGGSPSSSGSTANGSPGKSGSAKVSLPAAIREAMRTGDVKGLATVGNGYNAVRGTSLAGAMSLRVTYTRRN